MSKNNTMENTFRPYNALEIKAKRESNHFLTKIENERRSSFNVELYLKYLDAQRKTEKRDTRS